MYPLCREADETMQHFILHCSELESTRASFISALCESVIFEDNEELLGLILDPSTACLIEENSDSGETQFFFACTRTMLCFARAEKYLACYPDIVMLIYTVIVVTFYLIEQY